MTTRVNIDFQVILYQRRQMVSIGEGECALPELLPILLPELLPEMWPGAAGGWEPRLKPRLGAPLRHKVRLRGLESGKRALVGVLSMRDDLLADLADLLPESLPLSWDAPLRGVA